MGIENLNNIERNGIELQRAFFGSVGSKYEIMKRLKLLEEEYFESIDEAIEDAKKIQPSEISPMRPVKPFAFDLRSAIWKKLSGLVSGAIDPKKFNLEKVNQALSLMRSVDLKFYSTVDFPVMDRAAGVDGYISLTLGDDETIVTCDTTLRNEEKRADVIIKPTRVLEKDKPADQKEWNELIDKHSDQIVSLLLGPKEKLQVERSLKNKPLKTNIVFEDEK